jgi:hypothetical protein
MDKKAIKELQAYVEIGKKFDNIEALLEEVLYCLNQLPNTKVKSNWFEDTYDICSEINKYI